MAHNHNAWSGSSNGASYQTLNLASRIKRQELSRLYPKADRAFLDDVFMNSGCNIEKSKSVLSDHRRPAPVSPTEWHTVGRRRHREITTPSSETTTSSSRETTTPSRREITTPSRETTTPSCRETTTLSRETTTPSRETTTPRSRETTTPSIETTTPRSRETTPRGSTAKSYTAQELEETNTVNADQVDYREEARVHQSRRMQHLAKADEAHSKKMFDAASHYQRLAAESFQRQKKADRQAAAIIFEANNSRRDNNEIDLHGLHLEEAVQRVGQFVKAKRQEGKNRYVHLITGCGNNSKGGPKVKQAILNYLKNIDIKHTFVNSGMIRLTL